MRPGAIFTPWRAGTAEWERGRLGVATASCFGRIVTAGSLPEFDTYYAAHPDAGLIALPARAKAQLAIVDQIQRDGIVARSDIKSASALKALIDSEIIKETAPPSGAKEIQRTPPTLSGQRKDYMHELLAEMILGRPASEFQGNAWTERGNRLEPEAIAAYEFERGVAPQPIGLVYLDDQRLVGATPDWKIGDDVIGEVKCPSPAVHVGYLLADGVPRTYIPQVQGQLWVTGAKRLDFIAYFRDEEHGDEMPEVIASVEPDPDFHATLDEHIPAFVDELIENREKLRARGVKFAMDEWEEA